MTIRRITVGSFVQRLDKDEVVVVSGRARKTLERALSRVETSSLIVRLDMAPWDGEEGVPPIYEFEVSPDGLMFWGLFGRNLLREISPLADVALCIDPPWKDAYKLLSELTGWPVVYSWDDIPDGARVYLSADPTDIPADTLENLGAGKFSLITDPFCPKTEVMKITGGLTVKIGEAPPLSEVVKRFPDGFVFKPVWGFGSKDIYMYPVGPRYGWLKTYAGIGKKGIRHILQGTDARKGWASEWMIQPFFPPEPIRAEGRLQFRIWRIFAIRQSLRESFKLLGGLWNQRPSLKVHGASNTTNGLIVFEGGDRKPTKINPSTPPKKEKYVGAGGWYW